MAVIVVNGVPLQPKIDAAQPGDTLDVKAGGYAGRLKITKPLSIKGDGAVILDGGTGDGAHTVNVEVAAKNTLLSGLDLRHGSYAVRYMGDCTGSIAEHLVIPVVDFMYRGIGTAQTGGNGFVFEKCQGVEVRYNKISKCRAPSSQYVVDGGPFEFFIAKSVNVHHNEVWDCVNSGEFGKDPANPANNTDIRLDDNIFHGRANPLTATSDMKLLAHGILLRALISGSIARNVFDQVDFWAMNFDAGGTYGGSFGALTVKDNILLLIPGSNRMVFVKPGIPLSVFSAFDGNKVYTTTSSARVAEVNGIRYFPGDLAKFRTDTGFEKTSTWTVGPLPPIAPITPADPCAAIKAELAQANTNIANLTTERDSLRTQRDDLFNKFGQAKAKGAEIVAL